MRLTGFGVKAALFYLAMVGVYLASPYANLLFLLLSFLTLLWLCGAVWTLRNLRGVAAEVAALEPVPAGAGRSLRGRLRAADRARFQVELALQLEGGARAWARAAVIDGAADVALALPPLARGLYAVRAARVASTWPLGLCEARREVAAPGELVVYPAPLDAPGARSAREVLAQALGAGAAGEGDVQPASLRDHRDGDELRAVHWRATARRGSLVVREWEGGGEGGLEVVLDRRCAPQALEQALSLVSALAHAAREGKELLAVHSQGLQATFGEGHRPWHELLRFLAAAEVLASDGPAPPPVSPSVPRLPLEVARER